MSSLMGEIFGEEDPSELHKLNRRLDAVVELLLNLERKITTMDANVTQTLALVAGIKAEVAKLGTDLAAALAALQGGIDSADLVAIQGANADLTTILSGITALDATLTPPVPGNPAPTGTTGTDAPPAAPAPAAS